MFYQLLSRCQGLSKGKRKFRFRNKLFSLDATLIKLCASLFDWAKYRQTKGAVKLHLLLDHDGYLPVFAHVTEGRAHEVKVARGLSFPAGSIVAVDRGYWDYSLFSRWTEDGVYFITRMKSGASYRVLEDRGIPKRGAVLLDQTIRLDSGKCPHPLRRVEVWDDEKGEAVVFLSNHLGLGATTIASVYRDRWRIEIFFKTIKQNLKIKTFVGTSPNALLTQIWTALIVILILKYLKLRSSFGWSMSNLVAMLRYNLFTHRSLWEWIDSPYEPPPVMARSEQLAFDVV